MRVLAFLLILFSLPADAAGPVEQVAPGIERFTLTNGMEAIVIENHRVPAVSHMLWFRTGAGDDPEGKSGLAHYHEHMMFQGTHEHKAGEYAAIITRNGGDENAFTGHDATGYYVNIAKENLPLAMELEAERLRGLEPTEENAKKEREVIIEERRLRIENNPQALFAEQMNAALYLNHPYHFPVIGWKHEMEGLTHEDVLEFHRRHYHPGNAILVVSGDITAAELKPLAEKYYEPIPAGPPENREWKQEPPHLAARRLDMEHPNVKQPQWQRITLAPSVHWQDANQVMPLMLLEQVLGGGNSSRLYQALVVKRKLAASVSADYDGLTRGPGEFSLSATPSKDASMEELEKGIESELAKIVSGGIGEEELARAKTLLKAEMIYAREGLQSMAYLMGVLRILDLPPGYFTEWPKKIDAVTAAQVQEAARLISNKRASVTGILRPQTTGEADAR